MKMTTSEFYCTKCGKKGIPIQRNAGQEREPGHLKKLYCIYCGEAINMVEVRSFGGKYTLRDFRDEFELGNFDEGGNRKLPLGDFKKFRNELIQKGEYHYEKAID